MTRVYYAQNYHLVEIHSTQTFYLNNSTRDALGTGDNKTYLKVELPPLTKEWYFSFSAVQAERGQSLNLFGQLADLLDQTGITGLLVNAVTVPEGDIRCNVYLTDHSNAMSFARDDGYNHWTSGTRKNYTEGVVKITDILNPVVYLCFENPNSWDGMTISVEVTALVADKTEQEQAVEDLANAVGDLITQVQQNKAEKTAAQKQVDAWNNCKNTGKVLFEAGDYVNAMDYTQKALEMRKHPELYFNLGLIQWTNGQSGETTASYLNGLNLIYDLPTKEEAMQTLNTAISDIDATAKRVQGFMMPEVPHKLLTMKLTEVQGIMNWKRKQ